MVRSLLISVFFVFSTYYLSAQYDGSYAGARQAGMGGHAVTLEDGWSILNNPSGLWSTEALGAGIFFEQRFGSSELSYRGAGIHLPAGSGGMGIGFTIFGFDVYNEKRFALAYGVELFSGFRAGLSLDYLHTQIDDPAQVLTGNKGNITFNVGLQAALSPEITLGFSLFNPWLVTLSSYEEERIPAIIRLGMTWQAGERLLLLVEAGHVTGSHPVLKAGLEYTINEKLILRGGLASKPTEYGIGLETNFLGIDFHVAATYHLVLGYSPHGAFFYTRDPE